MSYAVERLSGGLTTNDGGAIRPEGYSSDESVTLLMPSSRFFLFSGLTFVFRQQQRLLLRLLRQFLQYEPIDLRVAKHTQAKIKNTMPPNMIPTAAPLIG